MRWHRNPPDSQAKTARSHESQSLCLTHSHSTLQLPLQPLVLTHLNNEHIYIFCFIGCSLVTSRLSVSHINLTSSPRMVHFDVRPSRSPRSCGVSPPLKLFGLLHLFIIVISGRDRASIKLFRGGYKTPIIMF